MLGYGEISYRTAFLTMMSKDGFHAARIRTAYPSEIPEALGESRAFLEFCERLSRVAPIDRPVLIIGERGTGKELAASRLHFLSGRWQGPLVALNCAALAPTLIESELFGYERGAFTGAERRRAGRFEAAHGGTLFLDELGAVPMEVQEKILRVVEYGNFERVGGAAPVAVDVRIVAATHADLPALVAAGRFKADLLDRLSFEVLHLPPLRDRAGDIPLLADHFARRMAAELGYADAPTFGAEAVRALAAHDWPGNVRELKNVVERAVYRAAGGPVTTIDFDPFASPFRPGARTVRSPSPAAATGAQERTAEEPVDLYDRPLKEAVATLERRMLARALAAARYNQRRAANLLGLTYDQFRGLKRKHEKMV